MVTWQYEQLQAHSYDRLRDVQLVVGEKQQLAPSGKRSRPDITTLDAAGRAVVFIEVVRTHLSDFPGRDIGQARETFTQRRVAETATELEWFAEHETVEGGSGNAVRSRSSGSLSVLDGMAYPATGSALLAGACTWNCARATAALKAQEGVDLVESDGRPAERGVLPR